MSAIDQGEKVSRRSVIIGLLVGIVSSPIMGRRSNHAQGASILGAPIGNRGRKHCKVVSLPGYYATVEWEGDCDIELSGSPDDRWAIDLSSATIHDS